MMDILCDKNNSQKEKIECTTDAVSNKVTNDVLDEGNGSEEQKLMEDEERLVVLLEQRLQFILRSLTKLFVSKNSNKKEYVFVCK